ncbi:unnamed protein product [Adineta ricciae]|uniref:Uncharacterized protein n=1 Tax=Adineta ricciae TaxID=249248 RepID=A0A815E8X7_ADIRI|nr:unnamed protein product [Adineta ricciae]CAF1323450.1 unnamed protein product [Adineta ricciae]
MFYEGVRNGTVDNTKAAQHFLNELQTRLNGVEKDLEWHRNHVENLEIATISVAWIPIAGWIAGGRNVNSCAGHRNTGSMKSPEDPGTSQFRAGFFDVGNICNMQIFFRKEQLHRMIFCGVVAAQSVWDMFVNKKKLKLYSLLYIITILLALLVIVVSYIMLKCNVDEVSQRQMSEDCERSSPTQQQQQHPPLIEETTV